MKKILFYTRMIIELVKNILLQQRLIIILVINEENHK